jgi:hypothetical protein
MKFVPIRDAVTPDMILASDGSDAVKLVRDPWFGGDFLNFEFSFRHDEQSDIKHSIWLVCDSMTTEEGSQKWYLTFLHDANGDSPISTTSSLTSFTCSSVQQISSTDSLIIRVLEWNNSEGTNVVTYRIKNDAKNTP